MAFQFPSYGLYCKLPAVVFFSTHFRLKLLCRYLFLNKQDFFVLCFPFGSLFCFLKCCSGNSCIAADCLPILSGAAFLGLFALISYYKFTILVLTRIFNSFTVIES